MTPFVRRTIIVMSARASGWAQKPLPIIDRDRLGAAAGRPPAGGRGPLVGLAIRPHSGRSGALC